MRREPSASRVEEPVLRAVELRKSFAGLDVLRGVSLAVGEAAIFGIIGPNGAGKTTLLNTMNGVYRADGGEVYLRGRRLTGLPVYEVARLGLARTFQVPRLFRRLSVLDNLLAATAGSRDGAAALRRRALDLLELVGLRALARQYADELSGGQQKLLEFARALMGEPHLVFMDEPFAGVHPDIKAQLVRGMQRRNAERGTSIVLVSHEVELIADLCTRLLVLHMGEVLVEGEPQAVLRHEAVLAAYLGA